MKRLTWTEVSQEPALTLLRAPGCPACRHGGAAEDRFFTWFMIESYNEPSTIQRLRASIGLCPEHSRRLLTDVPSWSVGNYVYEYVLKAAITQLEQPSPIAPCPACASRVESTAAALDSITSSLGRTPVATAFEETGGFCLVHLLEALSRSDGDTSQRLCAVFRRSLDRDPRWVRDEDRDTPLRRRLRRLLPVGDLPSGEPAASVLDGLEERFTVRACPICLSVGKMADRYLEWFGHVWRSRREDLERSGTLCATHLADLGEVDADAARWATGRAARDWDAAVARFQDRMASLPSDSLVTRLRSRPPSPRANPDAERGSEEPPSTEDSSTGSSGGLAAAMRGPATARRVALHRLRDAKAPCPACSALAATERRETALLVAALRDRPTGRRYEASHGACLHHVLSAPALAEHPLVREVVSARLAVLRWELEEADRKRAWPFRHEPRGPEASAWLRAPALLDGRTFEGGPPVDTRDRPEEGSTRPPTHG